jgi:hypothetical protein
MRLGTWKIIKEERCEKTQKWMVNSVSEVVKMELVSGGRKRANKA